MQVRQYKRPCRYQHNLKSFFVRCPLFRCGASPCIQYKCGHSFETGGATHNQDAEFGALVNNGGHLTEPGYKPKKTFRTKNHEKPTKRNNSRKERKRGGVVGVCND